MANASGKAGGNRRRAWAFLGSILGSVVAGWIVWKVTDQPTPDRPPEQVTTTLRGLEFSTPIRTKPDGTHRPIEVHADLDLDEGSQRPEDADLQVTIPFFQDAGRSMRALTSSNLIELRDEDVSCPPGVLRLNSQGSNRIPLREGKWYCVRTGSDNLARFSVSEVLTSWEAEATVSFDIVIVTSAGEVSE